MSHSRIAPSRLEHPFAKLPGPTPDANLAARGAGRAHLLPVLACWAVACLASAASPAQPQSHPGTAMPPGSARQPLTLEQIMADPDWMGAEPEGPYWADDGRAIYYERKEEGRELRDLYRQDLSGAPPVRPLRISDADLARADARGGDISHDRRWKTYIRHGNLFVKDLKTGAIRQVTSTADAKSAPRFMVGDTRISFRSHDTWYIYDRVSGLLSQPAVLRLEKDPARDDDEDAEFLQQQQRRLFDAVRESRERERQERERERELSRADPGRVPPPWYLGEKVSLEDSSLSPTGAWMLLVTVPKKEAKAGASIMPNYVTESGNVETRPVRKKVTAGGQERPTLLLLDLAAHERYEVSLNGLPGILDDPLKALREKAEAAKKAAKAQAGKEGSQSGPAHGESGESGTSGGKGATAPEASAQKGGQDGGTEKDAGGGKEKKPEPRAVTIDGIVWSQDGSRLALEVHASDNKDRWIATVDLASHQLVARHRLSDPAWVTWDYNDFGWLKDNSTLYFLSEESGWSHLYLCSTTDGRTRQLTHGSFEVNVPQLSRDGRFLYYRANPSHPGIHEIWRIATTPGAEPEQLTHLGGDNDLQLSLDETQLLVIHSEIARHPEVYVQANRPGGTARQVTQTMSAAFLAQDWTVPRILPIPSSHVSAPIYSRLYLPKGYDPAAAGQPAAPAVVFVHGAGYLQDASYAWSYYFHEFMFHSLLNQHGYIVLDMDYRASQGYGREWRTAIYRQMGHPELEDLQDGVAWLVANEHVDPARVGVYGGSYGGFMTLMALFRAPDLFACGAALRPVTDWAHYNQDYTSAILNAPEVDPEAYAASSPIEFAAGLAKPLQICHGMQDDNVFFQDSVRLVQRLIELKKQDFTLAPYPLESHAFKAPVAWLDEYRRIFALLERTLKR